MNNTNDWKPIETAPKEEVIILATRCGMYFGRKRYGTFGEPQPDSYEWRCESSGLFATPTHWMYAPKLPTYSGDFYTKK
jgi:hypothetical protein